MGTIVGCNYSNQGVATGEGGHKFSVPLRYPHQKIIHIYRRPYAKRALTQFLGVLSYSYHLIDFDTLFQMVPIVSLNSI